jgi:NitT/TauT family transport system ATP-binding protein
LIPYSFKTAILKGNRTVTQIEQHRPELVEKQPYIILEEVHKSFPPTLQHRERKYVYQGLNLTAKKGEVLGIIGPNAVGKTVLCNLLSHELTPDSGKITVGGRAPGKDIKVGYVYQNYRDAMFPWLNVLDNICLGPQFAHISRTERHEAAKQLLKQIGIKLDLEAFPYELSGGQQQMVAFLRAMLIGPELLLMDEPFQSLDLENRLLVEDVLLRTLRNSTLTVVLVSHDASEVVLLADWVLVLSKRPPHIVDILKIDLPNRRDVFNTPSEPGFPGMVAKVRMAFKEALRQC